MIRKTVIVLLLVIGIVTSAAAADIVTFKGATTTAGGELLMLTGNLTKPHGDGPFGAVVLLHGCSGIDSLNDMWAERLKEWGYVTLAVDSLGPRGESDICGKPHRVPPNIRAKDAHAAKSYLAGLPFVDSNRIAVMGMGHGGWTTLYAVRNPWYAEVKQRSDPFRAAVALYPYCPNKLARCDAPLLILIGELDAHVSAELCQNMKKTWMAGDTQHEVILKVYPGAFHCFDYEGMNKIFMGRRMQYDKVAAADAIIQVKNFLAKHMK
jgi:dienelactone hydrolase